MFGVINGRPPNAELFVELAVQVCVEFLIAH
jgi:hypothetical protein